MNPIRALLLLLLLHSEQVRPNAVGVASIDGVVVDRVTGAALTGISVELTGIVGTKVETYTSTTDKTGKFFLKNVIAGSPYWLIATPPRQDRTHMATVYGQRGLTGPGLQITLQSNQQMQGVRLALIPTGSISGRVLNEKGKPMDRKSVVAISPYYDGGPRALDYNEIRFKELSGHPPKAWGQVQTNSRGEFRIAGLPPGPYYLSVGGSVSPFVGFGGQTVSIAPLKPGYSFEDYSASTYFPGTTDPWAAVPIDLRAGASEDDKDIRITPLLLRTVRGVVVEDATGARVSSAQLIMVPCNAGPDSGYSRSLSVSKGSFEITSVLPDSYFIVAFANEKDRILTGRARIEVGRDDLEHVEVHVGPGFGFDGRVILEGHERNSTEMTQTRVTLRPKAPSEPGFLPELITNSFSIDPRNFSFPQIVDNGPRRSALDLPAVNGTVDSAGRLSFRSVAPWDYTIEVMPAFEDSYVKSIRMGSLDVLNNGITIDGSPSGVLEIVIGSDAGSIDGRVVDEKSSPVENIKVILIPVGARQNRSDQYKSAWSDASGSFRMKQIPPGDYMLYAWEQAEEGAWKDPEFVQLYEGSGTPVHIRARTGEKVETRIIPSWY